MSRRRRSFRIGVGRGPALLLIAALAGGLAGAGSLSAQQNETNLVARAVTAVKVERSCFVDTLQVTGVVQPRHDVLVRAERDGQQVSQILVEPGDTVTSGQVLLRLKQPEAQRGGAETAVQAPAAGLVYGASARIGAGVSASGEPLFRIARDGELELLGETPVDLMGRLAPDQLARLDIIGVGEVAGRLHRISTSVNPVTQLGQVAIAIGADPRVRIGVFGKATIELARRCGPALPVSAVLYGDGGAVVQVVRNDRIETRRVTVGLIRGDEAEVREGVSEGETVVARAGAFVRDGDRVLPVAARPQPAQ